MALGVLFGALVLAGCAPSPTGEASKLPNLGFNEIGEREYSIVLAGGPRMSLDRVVAAGRLRAARLALDKGFPRFAIVHEKAELRTKSFANVILLPGPPFWLPVGQSSFELPTVVLIVKLMTEAEGAAAGALKAADIERKSTEEK